MIFITPTGYLEFGLVCNEEKKWGVSQHWRSDVTRPRDRQAFSFRLSEYANAAVSAAGFSIQWALALTSESELAGQSLTVAMKRKFLHVAVDRFYERGLADAGIFGRMHSLRPPSHRWNNTMWLMPDISIDSPYTSPNISPNISPKALSASPLAVNSSSALSPTGSQIIRRLVHALPKEESDSGSDNADLNSDGS